MVWHLRCLPACLLLAFSVTEPPLFWYCWHFLAFAARFFSFLPAPCSLCCGWQRGRATCALLAAPSRGRRSRGDGAGRPQGSTANPTGTLQTQRGRCKPSGDAANPPGTLQTQREHCKPTGYSAITATESARRKVRERSDTALTGATAKRWAWALLLLANCLTLQLVRYLQSPQRNL